MTTETITNLNAGEFERVVRESDRPLLVDFWADWCQPCHMLSPTIQKLAEQYGDRVTVAKVNIDDARDVATEHAINSIPTVLIFDAGQETDRIVGVQGAGVYAEALDRRLA